MSIIKKPLTLEEKLNHPTEFVPFGATEPIRLTIAIVQDMCCIPTKSGKKCSNIEAQKFILYCQGNRLNPFVKDAYLTGYDGKDGELPKFSEITSVYAFLKRAEAAKNYDGMASGVILDPGWDCPVCHGSGVGPVHQPADSLEICKTCSGTGIRDEVIGDVLPPDQKLRGRWALVKLKDRSIPVKKRVLLSRFDKKFGTWLNDPAGMIVKVAEVQAQRDAFPSALGGMYAAEEMPSVVTGGDIGPVSTAPSFNTSPPPGPPTHTPPQIRQTPPQSTTAPTQPPSAPKQPASTARPAAPAAHPPRKTAIRKPGAKPADTLPFDPGEPPTPAGEPGEEQEPPPTEEPEDAPPGAEPPPQTPKDPVRALNALMVNDNVSWEQVILYCINKKWVDGACEIEDIPKPKLVHLVTNWRILCPALQAIEA